MVVPNGTKLGNYSRISGWLSTRKQAIKPSRSTNYKLAVSLTSCKVYNGNFTKKVCWLGDFAAGGLSNSSNSKPRNGLIIWGDPWDPAGWEMTPQFLKRWAWTVDGCTELLHSTSYWRQRRGEKALRFEKVYSGFIDEVSLDATRIYLVRMANA